MPRPYSAYLTKSEKDVIEELLDTIKWEEAQAQRVQERAVDFIEHLRLQKRKPSDLETFFQYYSLDTKEGLALMTMAEALLRIPDTYTAKMLIQDKVAATNWLKAGSQNKDWLAKAAGAGLALTSSTVNSIFSKVGEPVIRTAMMQAMRLLGRQFVIGETIQLAMKNSMRKDNAPYRMTYDMLGEGARSAEDAQRYFESYAHAIREMAARVAKGQKRPGICVKLSALHPRYEFAQKDICVPALTEKLTFLSDLAARHDLTLTVDAEEVDRLDLSLDIIEGTLNELSFKDWDGFGLAVQAYQKRALPLLSYIDDLGRRLQQKIEVRLVKGAYWDTEIKRAQVEGFDDYAVFTRKTNTDVSYLACAQKMLQSDYITPLYGTHNAHTIFAIKDMAKEAGRSIEFQKLYGMGNALYRTLREQEETEVSVYAPVGSYEDLLPYLVRRLLENGANSSFIKMVYDDDYDAEKLGRDPIEKARAHSTHHHPHIALPKDIYGRRRDNSKGLDLTDEKTVEDFNAAMNKFFSKTYKAAPLINGKSVETSTILPITNPANDRDTVGEVSVSTSDLIDNAFKIAEEGFRTWKAFPSNQRSLILNTIADLFEKNRAELMALCVREAGKTLPDARDEVREAVDFCRYYALKGEKIFDGEGQELRGPTGETNILLHEPRGTFVCISPWNFPFAIFTGQIVAALMAGNAVIAKPAEQTPLIAMKAVELMIKAGIPKQALTLLPGDGEIGAQIVQYKDVAGVTFTGSNEAAWAINKTLTEKKAAIVPLIAETGGQNAFIADSSALAEQVVDDVIHSAFGSAGQRCSAARILYVQDEAAPRILSLLKGAIEMLRVGEPEHLSTDVGPVIDAEALERLQTHKTKLDGIAKKLAESPLNRDVKRQGTFFAPCAYEIHEAAELDGEVFGPILHVIRFAGKDIDHVIDQINATGYGLTLGIHSRIDKTIARIQRRAKVGNVYVNRHMTGAVVGVQPFGGRGLSGTGPKAGGPDYLKAFANEKVISRDITASGGNASLVMIGD